jgi:hypothetical protein
MARVGAIPKASLLLEMALGLQFGDAVRAPSTPLSFGKLSGLCPRDAG